MNIELNNRFEILSIVLVEHLKRGHQNIDTRIFRCIVSEAFITVGESKNGKGHKEHVVPCAYLRKRIIQIYNENTDNHTFAIAKVCEFLKTHLKIVLITKEEARKLDLKYGGHDLKDKMPHDWQVGHDIFARLIKAGIDFKPYLENKKVA